MVPINDFVCSMYCFRPQVHFSLADAAFMLFKVLMKKAVLLKREASSQVVSKVLSVLFSTVACQGINPECVERALQVSRRRITLWTVAIMKGKEFGGKKLKTRGELQVGVHAFSRRVVYIECV